VLDVAGVRYAVNFDYTWHRADAFEGPGCGSIEFDDDRFTLVRVP
jgi:hypothetical protein